MWRKCSAIRSGFGGAGATARRAGVKGDVGLAAIAVERRLSGPVVQHGVDKPVFLRLLRAEVDVAVQIAQDDVALLPGMIDKNLHQAVFQPLELVAADHDVGHLPLRAAVWLVHVDRRVWQGITHRACSRRQHNSAKAGGQPDGGRAHGRADLLNRIVDSEARVDVTAR